MDAYTIYKNIAAQQFKGNMAPIKTNGVVIKNDGLYMVETDNMGFICPINVNISKYYGRRVSCTFNIYNNKPLSVPRGVPVMIVSITKLPV